MTARGRMTARVQSIAPQFLVDDLETARACYRDQLGFTIDFTYESFYAAVSRDGAGPHGLLCRGRRRLHFVLQRAQA